jgi:PAS domain S-box-containing protein
MESAISEKEHQLLLDAIKDHAIFMMDTEGYISSWNEGAARLKGYEEAEVMGKHFRMLFRREDQYERPDMEMKEALEHGKYEEDWWRLRKDGSLFWAHCILQPIFDDDKKHIGFAKITSDITQEKRANDLNDFLMNETTGYAIFLLDRKGKIAKWSKAAEDIIGYTEKEVAGKSLSIFYPGKNEQENRFAVERHLAKALNNRYEAEGWKVKKNGSLFWASYIVTPLHNKDGYVVMIRDLTDKRTFEQEHKVNTALTASNSQLEHFAFLSSHQLKEPVRKISVFCSMLEADSPRQAKLISKILKSCDRAREQLDDILQLSLIRPNKPLTKQDLNIVMENVLESLSETIREKHAVIECGTLPSAPVIPGQIEQLMQNLIGNSLKYCCTADNAIPIIRVDAAVVQKENIDGELLNSMKHTEEYLQIRVQDNGIAFEQAHSTKIFDLFTRLHGVDYEGTGIGLAICKRVAENHGGAIRAFSSEGEGTLFVLTLPYFDLGENGQAMSTTGMD